MSRYRKISTRMHGDARYRALSKPQPNGRDCFWHLLTNRETSNIPGVYRAREEALARDLEWDLEGYRRAFREVEAQGLAKADWDAGLVLIPKAFRHDPPANQNVIKSWSDTWDELPECPLKHEAWRVLKSYVDDLSLPFQQAFMESCPEPLRAYSGNGIGNGSGNGIGIPEPEPEPEPDKNPLTPLADQGGEGLDHSEQRSSPKEETVEQSDMFEASDPPSGRISKKSLQAISKHRADAERVLSELNSARRRVNPANRGIRPTNENLRYIAERLAGGASLEDCMHVVSVCEDDSKKSAESEKYFNSISPFRPANFARKLAMRVGGKKKARGVAQVGNWDEVPEGEM